MKINLIETENSVEITTQDNITLEKYEKDKPINFKKLLDLLVDLKFDAKIEYEKTSSSDIQNQTIKSIIYEILEKYNDKVDKFNKFKENK